VVLMHSPEGLSALGDRSFDVALCGHTHGGQIVWPSSRPIWLPPSNYNRAYPHGCFALDGAHQPALLVSRGVGYGGLPLRLFAPSDVLLVTLRWCEKAPHSTAVQLSQEGRLLCLGDDSQRAQRFVFLPDKVHYLAKQAAAPSLTRPLVHATVAYTVFLWQFP
jgi:hypothetical protein